MEAADEAEASRWPRLHYSARPMKLHRLPVSIACVAALAAAGCGEADAVDYDVASAPAEVDQNDERALAYDCITRVAGLDATLEGDDMIQVGEPPEGARIEFVQFSGEAEGRQLEGDAEGSVQIGSALLFVNGEPDEVLEVLEQCLLDVQ